MKNFFKNLNWVHYVSLSLSILGAGAAAYEKTDPKNLAFYAGILLFVHVIQIAMTAAGAQVSASMIAKKKSVTPPAVVTGMITFFAIFIVLGTSLKDAPGVPLSMQIEIEGCAATNAGVQPLIQATEKLGECVVIAAVSDLPEVISDPLTLVGAIAAACSQYGQATAAAILVTIEDAITNSPVPPEGGIEAGPDGGALVASVQVARLKKVRDAAAHVVAMNNVAAFGETPK